MPHCNICKEWMLYPESHKCPPEYEVWGDDYSGDDYTIIMANSPEEAGEKYADEFDAYGDYTIVNGSELEVKIRKKGDEEWKTYILSGEPVPQYRCDEKTKTSNKPINIP